MALRFGAMERSLVIAPAGPCGDRCSESQNLAFSSHNFRHSLTKTSRFPQKPYGMSLDTSTFGLNCCCLVLIHVADYFTHRIHRSCHDRARVGSFTGRALVQRPRLRVGVGNGTSPHWFSPRWHSLQSAHNTSWLVRET